MNAAATAPRSAEDREARALFLRGSAWTIGTYAFTQLLRLASNAVLWRLLTEEAFGLMVIVTGLMMELQLFSDVGIGPSIVQHERGDDPDYLNTAWTIQVIRGTALAIIAALLSLPAARFFASPWLTPLMLVVALSPLFQAFNSTKMFTASRRVALHQLAVLEMVSWGTGTLGTVVAAWLSRSPMALTVNWVVSAALRLLLGHLMLPGVRNRFRWDPTAVKVMVHFGRWVFLSTLLTFLAMNSDRLIFGKVVPMALLGVYGVASQWATIPGQILNKMFSTVAFPVLSRAKNLGEPIGPVFLETRGKALLAGAWATSGLVAGAAPLVRVFYDRRALDAIWIIPVLSLGGWFADLENSNSSAALALGHPKWLAAANGAKVVGMALLVPIGFLTGGVRGAVIGFAAADIFKYAISAIGASRLGVGAWRQDLALTAGILVVALGTLAVRALLGASHLPAILDALVVTVLVTGGWGAFFLARRRVRR